MGLGDTWRSFFGDVGESCRFGSQPNVLDANHMVDVIFGRGKKKTASSDVKKTTTSIDLPQNLGAFNNLAAKCCGLNKKMFVERCKIHLLG